jgi:hypothetical protein
VNHPLPAVFEQYVSGALEGFEVEAFETHVTVCQLCADMLAREARLEVQLGEAAQQLDARRTRSTVLRVKRWTAVGAAMAIAACALVVWLVQRPVPRLGSMPSAVFLPDSRDQLFARNDSVALDHLDESMDGNDIGASADPINGPARDSKSAKGVMP